MLIALGLRGAGVDHLLPCFVEPDSVYVLQMRSYQESDPALARHEYMFDYPRSVSHAAARIADLAHEPAADAPLADHLAQAGWNLVVARALIALLAVLAVPATWCLARAFLPSGAALAAAWFVAVSLADVDFSQQARPHAAIAGLGALALCAALQLRHHPGWREYALAGLAGGATFAVLHNGLLLVLPVALAHFLREGERGGRSRLWLALVPFAVCVPLFYADMLRAREGAGAGLHFADGVLSFGSHAIPITAINGSGAVQMLAGLWSFDPVFLALVGVGIVCFLWNAARGAALGPAARRDLCVLLAFGLPYALAFGAFRDSYTRFALPLLPLLAIAAAVALRALVRGAARFSRPVAWVAAALLLFASGAGAAKLAWLRTRPDTIDEAAQWVRTHVVPERERVWLQPGLELPLPMTPAALTWNLAETPLPYRSLWTHYLAARRPAPPGEPEFDVRALPWFHDSCAERVTADPAAAVTALFDGDIVMPALYTGGQMPNFSGCLLRGLAERGTGLARFAPIYGTERALPLMYDIDPFEEPSMLLCVLAARCTGPVIEVYRVGRRKLGEH